MSRYTILLADENLEIFTGLEEGLGTFFLTVADARTCTGESGSYLFHNYDHHPGLGMTLEEVARTLAEFGIEAPKDLFEQLAVEARRLGIQVDAASALMAIASPARLVPIESRQRVLGWQSVF